MLKKKHLLYFLIFVISFVCLAFFHTHGITDYDEGWFVYAGFRLLSGQKVYKDFQYLYNPGSLYVNALAFFLFGKSILASRILALINSCIAVGFLMRIGKQTATKIWITAVLILAYIFWGPGHINFVWPVMFCLTTAIGSGTLFIESSGNKKQTLYLFLTGVLSAWTFILKQNFGLAIFLANLLYFVSIKEFRNRKTIIWHAGGYATVIGLQLIYFLQQGTLLTYLNEIYFFTVVKIFQQGMLNSSYPWEYPSPFMYQVIKLLVYLSPVIISLFAAKKILTKKTAAKFIYFPIITIAYYALSIRPTTDYVHLSPLLALALIPLVCVYQYETNILIKRLSLFLFGVFFLIGAYTAFFGNYYRWHLPLTQQTSFSTNPRVHIWIDAGQDRRIREMDTYFSKNTQGEKNILIYNFAPLYYFILDKENPTPYDYMNTNIFTKSVQKDIANTLQTKKIRHLITTFDLRIDHSDIAHFITKNYKPMQEIVGFTVWKAKSF